LVVEGGGGISEGVVVGVAVGAGLKVQSNIAHSMSNRKCLFHISMALPFFFLFFLTFVQHKT
jgi:hypothetical protein